MSRRGVHNVALLEPASRFDTVIEWLVIALLVFMPAAFGAVEAWSELIVFALIGLTWLCLLLKHLVRRDVRWIGSWSYLPIVLFLLLVAAQLVPLPRGIVEAIAPATAVNKSRLLADVPDAQSVLSAMTLSYYPHATRHALRLVLGASILFVIVLNVYRRPEQVTRLLLAIALIGGAAALLALAQQLSGAEGIYWQIRIGGKPLGGPFVNRNHFAQFINLSLGAALALLLVRVHEAESGRHRPIPELLRRLRDPRFRVVQLLTALIVIGAISIFLSGSRGGMLALICALAATTLVLGAQSRMSGRAWLFAILSLVIFSVLLYAGFDAVYDRLATLQDPEEAAGGRLEMNREILTRIVPAHAAVGIGFGAHEVVYPMFSNTTMTSLATYVENEYVQALEELGISGLALIAAFIAMLGYAYVSVARNPQLAVRSAAYGLGFGIIAIMVHSLSDFGQRIPAVGFTTAVLSALLIGVARIGDPADHGSIDDRPDDLRPPRHGRLVAGLLLAVSIVVGLWVGAGAVSAARAESYWAEAYATEQQLQRQSWEGSDDEFIRLIREADAAATTEPRDVHYRYWLNVYRWYALARDGDPATEQVILTAPTRQFTSRIVEDLHVTRTLCPTFGPPLSLMGRLELFVLDDPDGARHIRLGYELTPADPMTTFLAGRLDVREKKWEASLEKFQRAVKLGYPIQAVVEVYVEAGQPELALTVADTNTAVLMSLAQQLEKSSPQLAQAARARARELLEAQVERDDAPPAALAAYAAQLRREGNHERAAAYYRRAVAAEYGNVNWRLELARSLAELGRPEDAIHEARVCLRLRPQMAAAEKLIEDLSVRSRTTSP